jgi:hypothetical protein
VNPARRPAGIAVDLPSALPAVRDRADGRGVVVLRNPLSREILLDVLRGYAQGFLGEDIAMLAALLAPDAQLLMIGSGMPSSTNVMEVWGNRLRSFDYSRLAGTEIFRPEKIQVLTSEEAKDLLPRAMRAEELLVVVPIQAPRLGGDALFPERVCMVLRREKGRYVVVAVAEEFTP